MEEDVEEEESDRYELKLLRGHHFENNNELVYWVKWVNVPGYPRHWPVEQDYVNENDMSCPELIQDYWMEFRDQVIATVPLSRTQKRSFELFVGRKWKECFEKKEWQHQVAPDHYDSKNPFVPVPKFLLHPIFRVTKKNAKGQPLANDLKAFDAMLVNFISNPGLYNNIVLLFALKHLFNGESAVHVNDIPELISSNKKFLSSLEASSEELKPDAYLEAVLTHLEKLMQTVDMDHVNPTMAKFYDDKEAISKLKKEEKEARLLRRSTGATLKSSSLVPSASNEDEKKQEETVQEAERPVNAEAEDKEENSCEDYKNEDEKEHVESMEVDEECPKETIEGEKPWEVLEKHLEDLEAEDGVLSEIHEQRCLEYLEKMKQMEEENSVEEEDRKSLIKKEILQLALRNYKFYGEPENRAEMKYPKSLTHLIKKKLKSLHYWNTDEDCIVCDIYNIEDFPVKHNQSLDELYKLFMTDMLNSLTDRSNSCRFKKEMMLDVLLIVKNKKFNELMALTVFRDSNFDLEGLYIPVEKALELNSDMVERCLKRQLLLANKST